MILAGTGHRMEKIHEQEGIVRSKILKALMDAQPDLVIAGMANGFDLWLASEAIKWQIPVWSARPWAGHRPRVYDRDLYDFVCSHSTKIVDVDPTHEYPGAWIYQKRNEWMVDNATHILAYWDGTSGGTANCIHYANAQHKPIRNVYA